jgi:hypothetical protein
VLAGFTVSLVRASLWDLFCSSLCRCTISGTLTHWDSDRSADLFSVKRLVMLSRARACASTEEMCDNDFSVNFDEYPVNSDDAVVARLSRLALVAEMTSDSDRRRKLFESTSDLLTKFDGLYDNAAKWFNDRLFTLDEIYNQHVSS